MVVGPCPIFGYLISCFSPSFEPEPHPLRGTLRMRHTVSVSAIFFFCVREYGFDVVARASALCANLEGVRLFNFCYLRYLPGAKIMTVRTERDRRAFADPMKCKDFVSFEFTPPAFQPRMCRRARCRRVFVNHKAVSLRYGKGPRLADSAFRPTVRRSTTALACGGRGIDLRRTRTTFPRIVSCFCNQPPQACAATRAAFSLQHRIASEYIELRPGARPLPG